MEIIVLIFGIINCILLIILLINNLKNRNKGTTEGDGNLAELLKTVDGLKNKIDNLDQTNVVERARLSDEIVRQADSTIKQVMGLSDRIMDSQEKQQEKISVALDKIESEMNELRGDNRESFHQINGVITEKMQKILDEKLNGVSATVVNTMSELGNNLRESQEKQQKITSEKLEKLENSFAEIRNEISTTLENIRNSNTESLEKLRKDNQESLDRVNNTVFESQERQQKSTTEKLEKLETNFGQIRTAIADILGKISRDNTEKIEMIRKDNQESLDKINSTVDEKLQKTLDEKLNGISETVVKNMSELGKYLNESQDRQQKIVAEKLEKLEAGFEKIRAEIHSTLHDIRTSNSESMEKLRRDNQESLDKINNTVNEKLQKTLDDKFSQSFEAVNKRLAEVYEGLGEMRNVASGVSDLKNVLSNVKTRGIMGEIQLGAIMNEILAPEQYGEQVNIVPERGEKVDFAVKLPGMDDGNVVYLPIDCKFPGDTYSNLVDAYNIGNPNEIREKRKLLETEINRCAKSIHDKYIIPPYTTGFAIMFLPFEGLYAEVVNMGLVEQLQQKYKVNIAGPSTMAAMLNSLQMGFQTLAIQKKSGEVWKILADAKKEFSTFADVLKKTRDRLRKADEDLDSLIGTRTNMINRKLSAVSEIGSLEEAENRLIE